METLNYDNGKNNKHDGTVKHRSCPSLRLSSNQVSFRLLCHLPVVSGVIGKSGSIVKVIEQETGAKVLVENTVPSCHERVIHVVSTLEPKKVIILRRKNEEEEEGEDEEQGEEFEVSFAQHGLVRVFERILEVKRKNDEDFPFLGGVACKLLADHNLIGFVMGKGGKRIEKIRIDSGAQIKVLHGPSLPPCALSKDELIQITGDVLAVKKAIIAVSQCLQDVPALDSTQMIGSMPSAVAPSGTYSDLRHEFFPHHNLFRTPTQSPTLNSSIEYAGRGRPMPSEVHMASTLHWKNMQHAVEFKLISTDDKIGALIGKRGIIVKALQNETGASIRVAPSLDESDDRVITVSALETPDSRYSPAQNALVRVFTRCIEVGGIEPRSSVTARLLVPSDQAGCLIGKGGSVATELRRATATSMWVRTGDQVPKCASENERVLEIKGNIGNVQDALFNATDRLRDNLFAKMLHASGAGEMSSYEMIKSPISPFGYQSMGPSYPYQQATVMESHLRLNNSMDHPPSQGPLASRGKTKGRRKSQGDTYNGRGLTTVRGGLERASESTSAVVANTTLEILVPEQGLAFVYGENDSNLHRIREISGAEITVNETVPGTTKAMVVISGTPDQTQAAQTLLYAFLRGGRSSSDYES